MIQLFDTHCHLQDDAFDGDALAAIMRARESGVVGMTLCGYDAPANLAALELARRAGFGVYPTVGYHPHEAATVTQAMLDELESQARLPQVVAVGEIGLDFYRDLSPHPVQRTILDAQLAIALRVGKPVSIHTRAAEAEIAPPLAEYAAEQRAAFGDRPVGVMHCFGGTAEQALNYSGLGFLISIACTITYPSNAVGRSIAAEVPLESLVIETDSPYLPPQTRRGKRNEPAFVGAAAEAIAATRGITFAEVAAATTANAARLFVVAVPSSRELAGTR